MTSSDARPIASEVADPDVTTHRVASTPTTSKSAASEPVARIFDVQRYSLNDGTGIRTVVFFKGCPLACPWCSNPESRSRGIEFTRREAQCLHCDPCPLDPAECPTGAYRQIGRDIGLAELEHLLARDEIFHRVSGGGVTLSGGEVLLQAPFAIALLGRLRAKGIATAIETTGHGSHAALLELGRLCDEVLFDFKIMDPRRAHAVLGINLPLVLAGFADLVAAGVRVVPRLPLIPTYTMTDANLDAVLDFLRPFRLPEIHLLPLHHYGASKYELLGIDYGVTDLVPPTAGEVDLWRRRCEAEGYRVVVGG